MLRSLKFVQGGEQRRLIDVETGLLASKKRTSRQLYAGDATGRIKCGFESCKVNMLAHNDMADPGILRRGGGLPHQAACGEP